MVVGLDKRKSFGLLNLAFVSLLTLPVGPVDEFMCFILSLLKNVVILQLAFWRALAWSIWLAWLLLWTGFWDVSWLVFILQTILVHWIYLDIFHGGFALSPLVAFLGLPQKTRWSAACRLLVRFFLSKRTVGALMLHVFWRKHEKHWVSTHGGFLISRNLVWDEVSLLFLDSGLLILRSDLRLFWLQEFGGTCSYLESIGFGCSADSRPKAMLQVVCVCT